MNGPTFPEITVQLTGEDGNVFAIIGAVARALRTAGHVESASGFVTAAVACPSYDDVLALVMRTVVVT